jgi:hypothetical protein
MARDRIAIATLVVVLLLLLAPATAAITGPSHTASSGVVYQTNSGLEVELGDQREVEAAPFEDDATFASDGVAVSAPGPAEVRVTDQTFGGETMQLSGLNASANDITATRDDLNTDVTIEGGADQVIVHNVSVGDNETDLEVAASSETTITLTNVRDTDGIQAVDSSGEPVAGDTDTSDNEASLTLEPGTYALRLQDGPSNLAIRDVLTQDLITETDNGTDINVTVQFFGDDGSVQQRTTSDGTVDMTGLPAEERFAVTVEAGDEYVQRQAIISSILDQQAAYLLPQDVNVTTVEPRFILEDPSNQFDTESSEIVLERPLQTPNGTEFVAVAGDRVGINGYDVILERDQRYRVIVTDPDSGAQREIGEFTPTQSEQVTLTVQDVEFDSVSEVNGLDWTARLVENENDANEVEFIYRDTLQTDSLSYEIHERGNESNVLTAGSADGNVTVSEIVPPGEENTVWVIEWEATRASGETLEATRPVSSDQLPVGPSTLPQNWQTIIAMIVLIAVAGLFGAANPGVGGIATAATGGVFFLLGWLPDNTGGLMVGLALMIAVLSYGARRARGATA